MRSEPAESASHAQRLHPTSLLFGIGSAARKLLLPGIAVLFFSRGSNIELWIMILFLPALVATVVRFVSYRYRLRDDELVVREGIITRNERHIPYARIQNIDRVQNPLHRLFGVAEVRLETAGGARPEAVMRVLSLQAVETMRARVFAGRREQRASASPVVGEVATVGAEGAESRTLLRLPARELVMYGVISNRGMVVVAAALGALSQLDPLERWWEKASPETLEGLPGVDGLGSPFGIGLTLVAVVLAALLLLRSLSIALALTRYHGFRLRRRGEDLRADYGLLTRVSKTVPRQRVQLLTVTETPLHRCFGRAAVHVETAGSAGDEESPAATRLALAPLVEQKALPALLREVLPEIELSGAEWRAMASGARGRVLRRSLLLLVPVFALAGAGVARLGSWWPLLALLLLPLPWIQSRLFVRHTAYALLPAAIAYRSGWWTRHLSVARFSKIQAVQVTTTPFDRRHEMAALRVDTAGSARSSHPVAVRFLEASVAGDLMRRLSREADRTAFRW